MRLLRLNNREFFNSMADKWDMTVNHDEGKIKHILDLFQIAEGGKILDVGTGTGVMIPFLHSYIGDSGSITAIDVAEKMIEVAKRKFSFKNVEYIAGDVLEKELPHDNFDCIMCYSMFPHFEDKKAAIGKLAKYLKKGGKFVICHSQSREAINNLHKDVSEAVKNDSLPTAEQINQYYRDTTIDPVLTVDNDDMFVVIGRKI